MDLDAAKTILRSGGGMFDAQVDAARVVLARLDDIESRARRLALGDGHDARVAGYIMDGRWPEDGDPT